MKKHKIKFLQKPSCTTCRKARLFLEQHGAELELRSLDEQRLSEDELQQLIGDRDYIPFLNPRNELYRSRNMKEHAPGRSEAVKLMVANPNLIRRPVVISGKKIILGYDEQGFRNLLR
jgi:arsenate reductase (glutaredoxin)